MTATPMPATTPPPSPEALELLSQMHDIAAPTPVGWWPLAPGWWIVAIISLILSSAAFLLWYYNKHQGSYRGSALYLLRQLNNSDDESYLLAINQLLKRVALRAYPRLQAHIVAVHGNAWTDWLSSSCTATLPNDALSALGEHSYQANTRFDCKQLEAMATTWIKHHRSEYDMIAILRRQQEANKTAKVEEATRV